MSERFYTTVAIGGTLRADLDEFRDLIEGFQFGDPEGSWKDNLIDGIEVDSFSVTDSESRASGGAELLEFCREHDLAYTWDQDASGSEYDREFRYWGPGFSEERQLFLTNDGDPFLRLDELVKRRDEGASLDDLIGTLATSQKFEVGTFRICLTDPPQPGDPAPPDTFSLVGQAMEAIHDGRTDDALSRLIRVRDLMRVQVAR